MLKICLNWKVLVGLAAVVIGVYTVAPGALAAALPILALAACPLSMLLMMRVMHGGQDASESGLPREDPLAHLKSQRAALDAEIGALERGDELSSAKPDAANG